MDLRSKKNEEPWRNNFTLIYENYGKNLHLLGVPRSRLEHNVEACHCPEGSLCLDMICNNYSHGFECMECNASCENNAIIRNRWKAVRVEDIVPYGHCLIASEAISEYENIVECFGRVETFAEFYLWRAYNPNSYTPEWAVYFPHVMNLKNLIDDGAFLNADISGSIYRIVIHSCNPNSAYRKGSQAHCCLVSSQSH